MLSKCYPLGVYEYGFTRSDPSLTDGISYLSALKTFYSGADDNTARKAYIEGTSTTVYIWTRSASSGNEVEIITTSGTLGAAGRTNSYYIRPAISVNPNTPVTISGGNTYLAPT